MTENDNNENEKSKKKIIIISLSIFGVIAVLLLIIYYFVSQNNATAQISDLKNNVHHNDYRAVANQLSTNKRHMTDEEAKHLIDYFKSDDNYTRFNKDINEIKHNLNNDNITSNLGSIKDKHQKSIIDISRNGKKFFFLDKVSMEPQYREVYIQEKDNTATYNFSKSNNVAVDKNKINDLGSFIVGDYDVKVNKEFKDGPVKDKIDGKIHINTDKKADGKHIIATQDFNQTTLKIKLHDDDKLKNKQIYINNHNYKYSKAKTYGYLPNNKSINIKAKGELGTHVFSSNSVQATEAIDNNTQVINLHFNKHDINKKLKADKKTENHINKFIQDYMDHLNKAYKKTQYKPINEDIKNGSNAEKFMKPKFDHKQDIKYTSTKVVNIKKLDDEYKVSVSKKYHSMMIKTDYYLQKNDSQFVITKIEDTT